MKTDSFFYKFIAAVLCLCTFLQAAYSGYSRAEQSTGVLYVKDVKLIYADSAKDAEKKVPEGYFLYDGNINDGTGELGVYICYSVTYSADEAVTDIRVMNENGNFNRGTFNDKMDRALEELGQQAADIHSAIVNEFVPNLEKGLPGAKYAYDQLNIFMFDENTRLGDHIRDGHITPSDIAKMLLVCHKVVLSAVLSLIAQGLQRGEGEDWLDRLETMKLEDYEMNAALQTEYAELIGRFQGPMSDFSDVYNIMVYTDEVRDSMTAEQIALYSEDLADEETVKWWNSLWEILNSHILGGSSGLSAEYLLVEWNLGEGVANYKICMLIDALTEGQRTLMQIVGPINFILNDVFTEDMRIQAEDDLAPIKEENGTVSLWGGVDTGIFDAEVGITSEAYDEMVTAANYDVFTQENDILEKSVEDYISIVSNYAGIISGGLTLLGGILVFTKGYTGTVVAIRVLAHIGVFITKGILGAVLSYGTLIITCVCLLANLIIWIIKEIEAGKPPEHDRTTIPKYMIDSVVDNAGAQLYETYRLVDNVQSDSALKTEFGLSGVKNMSGADINANKGYHWAALYISYSEAVGNPVQAEFTLSEGVDLAPDGFIPLRHFNRRSEAVDLNGVDEYNASDKNIYVYYRGEKLGEDHRVYKYVRQIQAVSVDLRYPNNPDKYRYSTEEALAVAKKQLTGASPAYYVIDHNFSSDPNIVTLIGWNGTNSKSDAIKDIRLVLKSTVERSGAAVFGGVSYANMGSINEWSLFVCRMKNTDIPPVKMLKVMKRNTDPSADDGIGINMDEKESFLDTDGNINYGTGWEAVNEFTGGGAVCLGEAGVQMYFMPEKTFTEGADYLAGIEVDAYISNEGFIIGADNCCHVDIWDNKYENYRAYKESVLGEHFFESSIINTISEFDSAVSITSEIHGYTKNNPNCPYIGMNARELLPPKTTSAVKYNLTKNPYRAIYGLTVRTGNDNELRNSFISYDGYGYALCPVEITSSMCGAVFEEFGYKSLLNSGKEFSGKTFIISDREHHSGGVAVNCDITQTVWPYEDVSINSIYASGYSPDRTPLTAEDVIFSARRLEESEYPDNFISVPYIGGDGSEACSVAPFTQKIRMRMWDYSTVLHASIFDDFYCYFRSEIGVDENRTTYYPGKGEYVKNIMLASKEKIRTSVLLTNDKDAECKDIPYKQLETQLISMGATTTYKTNIGTDYYSGGNSNANTVYLGLTRTDDASQAIRDIRFYVCKPGEKPLKTMKVSLNIDGREQKVEYELVDDISITSKANLDCSKVLNSKGIEVWEEKELLTERQAYIYVCRNKTAFPEAITDIQITQWCSFGTFTPVLSFNGETIYTVKKQSSVNLHVKDAWFEEGSMFSFRREGNNDRYVSELAIRNGGDENKVRSALIEAGYSVVNKDMNEFAAGDHVYIGCKYTDDKDSAITNVMTLHKKDKYNAYSVTDENHIYKLVADVDLNKGAGGDYIYLYYTKDARAGSPIVELYGSGGVKEHTDALYNHQTVRRLWDFKHSNLNAGTTVFTANIYLVMKREGNTGKYISDIKVVYAWSKSGALEKLKDAGYLEYIDKDLNDGTGSSQWIYIGYKRTDDPDKAIRDLMVFKTSSNKTNTVNGIDYKLASNVNLNRHCNAFSDDLFLYYTRDEKAGDPITALYCTDTPVENKKDESGYHRTTKAHGYNYGNAYVDLNSWAGGDYIYLVMVSQPVKSSSYTLNVVDGTSERYSYRAGESVTVTANEKSSQLFSHWTADGIDISEENKSSCVYTFTMPKNDVTLTAVFKQAYKVTLVEGAVFTNGSTDGLFAEGDTVEILWNDAKTHMNYWIYPDMLKTNGKWANPISFTMPAYDVNIDVDKFDKTDNVELVFDEPVDGQTLPTYALYTVSGKEYKAPVRWYDGDAQVETAQEGKVYRVVVTLEDNGNDRLVFAESGTATLNDETAESWTRVVNGVEVVHSVPVIKKLNLNNAVQDNQKGNHGVLIAIAAASLSALAAAVVIKKRRK